MFGRKKQKQQDVSVDYLFVVPTQRFGDIGVGLLNHGDQIMHGKLLTPDLPGFCKLVKIKIEAKSSYRVFPDYAKTPTMTEGGESRSLSQVVEELYVSTVESQPCRPNQVKNALFGLLPLASGFVAYVMASYLAPQNEAARDISVVVAASATLLPLLSRIRKVDGQYKSLQKRVDDATKNARRSLLELGVDEGIITPKYLIR